MDLKLQGRKALITGASKGIGAAITRALAVEGCNVTLAARSKEPMFALATELAETHNIKSDVIPIDLAATGSAERLAQKCPDIDILINNSGAIPSGRLDEIDETTWRATWDLKVFGYINLCRSFYALMAERHKGVIINIIGASGERPKSNYICGAAANSALMSFTQALGGDSLYDGIRVVGINPGPVSTERLITLMKGSARDRLGDPERWPELLKPLPEERAASVEEIADFTVFIASNRSTYTSGCVLTVDGGYCNRGSLM